MINMGKNKKEEIIHRRAFFRKAVKGIIPIVAFSLTSFPVKANTLLSTGSGCNC